MARRGLKELSLIDDFMANAVATNERYSKQCYRKILSVLLEREIGDISIHAQSIFQGEDTDKRGIRLDVEIIEKNDVNVVEKSEAKVSDKNDVGAVEENKNDGDSDIGNLSDIVNIYDYEPHKENDLDFPRHNRFYQAKIDGHYIRSGWNDFSKIPNLYVITITNFDIFGEDYMLYTVEHKCKELPQMPYDDGLKFLYFNTKGTKGGSEAIHNMLKYIEDSSSVNAVDEATREVSSYVEGVKNASELESGIMTLQDKIDMEKYKSYNEGKLAGMEAGMEAGRLEGNTEGQIFILIKLQKDGLVSVEEAANYAGMSVPEFDEMVKRINTERQRILGA